jgi:hypothetical protein
VIKLDPKLIPIGLPWCREEDYPALLAVLEDADQLPKLWKDFITLMEKAERSFQDEGKIVRRININPHLFRRWCAIKHKRIDTDACHKFAAKIAIKEQRNAGGLW